MILRVFRSAILVFAALFLLGAVGCSPESKKQGHFQRADQHFTAGDYDKAEIEYLNVLKIDPKSGPAISKLSEIYLAQGRTARAIAFLMRARELLPEDTGLRLRIGQLYASTGKLAEARQEAEFVLARVPQDPLAPGLLVSSLLSPSEADLARSQLLNLPAPAPTQAPVLTALATLEMRLGRLPEAEKFLAQAKTQNPKNAMVYSVLGAWHLARQDLVQAEEALQQAAALSPVRSLAQLQLVQFKLRKGEAEAAKKILQELLTKAPDFVSAWIALADFSLMQNNLSDCAASLEKALARDPQNIEGLLVQGRLQILKGETEKAIVTLERLKENYPQATPVYVELGRAYAASGDLTKAIASLNQAVILAPNQVDAILLLAQMNLRKGDATAAISSLRKLTEQRPGLINAQLMLADAYRLQNDPEKALAIYSRLGKDQPNNALLAMQTGMILAQQGKTSEARRAFEHASELNPENPTAIEQLVNLDLRQKDFKAAEDRVTNAMAGKAKLQGPGELLLAKIALAREDGAQAVIHLQKAIELMPDSPTAYFMLAGVYTRTNRQQEALTQLLEVIKRDPKQQTAQTMVGIMQDRQGDFKAARESYEKLLTLNPRSLVALNNLAYLYSEKFNDLDKALDLAQRARQLAQIDPHTADTLGWILYKKRQYPWALNLLQEAAEKLSESAEVQYHLGRLYYVMGDEVLAKATLEKALQLEPTAVWQSEARECLAVLAVDPSQPNSGAITLVDGILSARPEDSVALNRKAVFLEQEGKLDQAVKTMEMALASNSGNVKGTLALARLHAAANHPTQALEYAKAARKLAPNDPDATALLGQLAYQNKDFPWSASLLQEAARQNPNSAELQYALALSAFSVGRVSEAETALRTALSLANQQPSRLFKHSAATREMLVLLGLAGNPPEAIKQSDFVTKVLKDQPDSAPALMAAGAKNEQQKDRAGAIQYYEKVLGIFPDFFPAKARLAILSAQEPKFEQKYFDWALQARSSLPDQADLTRALAILTYLKGDANRAVNLFKECQAAFAGDAVFNYYLGRAQLQSKDAVTGKTTLETAIKLGLPKDLVNEAKKALESLKP